MTLCFTYAAVHCFSLYSPVIFYSLNSCLPSDVKDYFYQNLQTSVIEGDSQRPISAPLPYND